MQDVTDNRLPYAPLAAFTQDPITDPLVDFFNVISAENDKQEQLVLDKVRQEEQMSGGLKHTPYYVYYHESGAAAAGGGAEDGHRATSANNKEGGPMSFLQKAKQKVAEKIDKLDRDSHADPHHNDGGAAPADGSGPAESFVAAHPYAVSMVIEEDEEDSAPPGLGQEEVDALVAKWSDESAVKLAMEEIFQQLPVAYGNTQQEIKCERSIAALIEDQRKIKETLDAAFRLELHVYQRKALPAIPIIEETCEALDSSQGESRYTLRMLKRTRQQAGNKVRLIALHRRRHQRRLLMSNIESVRTWEQKTEGVCRSILAGQYAQAALTLGARLKPYDGKYFARRSAMEAAAAKAKQQAAEAKAAAAIAAAQAEALQAVADEGSANHSFHSNPASSPSPSAAAPEGGEEGAGTSGGGDNTGLQYLAAFEAKAKAGQDAVPLQPQPSNAYASPSDDEEDGDVQSDEDEETAKERIAAKIKRRAAAAEAQQALDAASVSCLERVLTQYYTNAWDSCDAINSDMTFDDFLMGASSEVRSLHCGMASLGKYFALRLIAGKVIGVRVRDDVARLLTQPFDQQLLLGTLRGLHALHIRRDDVASFFLELIDPALNAKFRAALCDVVGEDAGATWEEVARSLVPSELHPCTVSLLSTLADTLRNVMKLALACSAMAEEHTKNPLAFGTEAEGLTVFEGCKFLSGLSTRVIHRCFGAMVSYGSCANLKRGKVEDCLHVYRLLHMFILMCSGAINDKSVGSTTNSLKFQWQAIYTDHFRANTLDEVLKVIQSESFSPFPVNAGDFQELQVLFERQDEEEAHRIFSQYLKLAPPLSLAPRIEEHLALDVLPNPFRGTDFITTQYRPVEALTDRKALSLFDDGHAIFTFSSFMVCRSMIEAVNNAKGLASVAGDMLHTIHGLAAVYTDFITTHFVAASEELPLDLDPKTPAAVQGYVSTLRSTSSYVASTCPSMVSAGFPYLPSAMCMQWKARRAAAEGGYAMVERASAIASLETVSVCHRLCIQALTGLLEATELAGVADMNESVSGTSKYAAQCGFRQLAKNVCNGETIISLVEKNKWDGNVSLGTQQSGYTTVILAELDAIAAKVKVAFKDMPKKPASMLMQHCVFNACLAFVEGLARVKKFSDSGKTQVFTDALYLTKTLKERFPSTSAKLVTYVMKYAQAVMGQWQDVLALLNDHHAQYTTRQLVAFGDREGFMKKREVNNILENLYHEDRLPLDLIDSL